MDSTLIGSMRSPCFIEGDDGLASITDVETGSSINSPFLSRSLNYNNSKRSSLKGISSSSITASLTPRSVRFYEAKCEENHPPYFLEACFLCKKPLGENRDIFMYRGDTPFCSEQCRQEQIEIDEIKERNCNNLSSSMKAIRKDQKKSSPNKKNENYPVHTGAVVAG